MTACLLSSSLTMVMAVFAAQRGDRAWTRNWLLATMVFGTAFIVLHGMEWSKLIGEGLTLPGFPQTGARGSGELADVSKNVAAVSRDVLRAHCDAHAARHHWRDLPGRGRIPQVVPAGSGRALAAGYFLIPSD